MKTVRAADLKPGHKLFFTLETVVRSFVDKMTPEGYINVLLEKPTRGYRTAVYKKHRRIKLL